MSFENRNHRRAPIRRSPNARVPLWIGGTFALGIVSAMMIYALVDMTAVNSKLSSASGQTPKSEERVQNPKDLPGTTR